MESWNERKSETTLAWEAERDRIIREHVEKITNPIFEAVIVEKQKADNRSLLEFFEG